MTPQSGDRVAWQVVGGLWLLVIGWCTLRSAPEQAADVANLPWYCVVCGDSGIADVFLNILLFLPLGLALRGMGWPLRRTVLVMAAISTGIEVFQENFLIGRDGCVGDVMSNTIGATVGWLGYVALPLALRPSAAYARRATTALLVLMAGIWLATGAGLQPSLTDDIPWIGQPMHDGRGKQAFPGTLQQATLDGLVIPNEEMAVRPRWRDSIVFDVRATRATAQVYRLPIIMLRIVDTAHVVQAVIDQIGDDARLRLRVRSSDWLLHNPRWLVGHAMRMAPGVPWSFRWLWHRDRFVIDNSPVAGPAAPPLVVPLSVGLGWAFIHPFVSVIGTNRLLWTVLWLGWWFGALGWFGGRLGAARGAAVGAVAIATFIGASLWWGFAVQWTEVAAAALACALTTMLAMRRPHG